MSKEKKTNQSEQILDAAYKCIASKGYANVSLRQIANEAGVALSQLHYYFGSKKDLFIEITKRVIEKYLIEAKRNLEKETIDENKTYSLVKFFKEKLQENPEHFRILYDLSSLALWSDSFKGLLSSLFKDLTDILEESFVSNNLLKEKFQGCTSKALARMILGVLMGIALQDVLDPNNNKEINESFDAMHIILNSN